MMKTKMIQPSRMKLASQVSLLILVIFILSACQPTAAQTQAPVSILPTATSSPTTAPTTAPTMAAAEEVVLQVATDPALGKILVDGKGMTLYMFTMDEPDKSNCAGDCLVKWPPLLTQGSPKLGEGVDDSLVGTAKMADGSLIVTYNGMPLYYWFKDTKPGDTSGQNVGEVWYVVSPDGKAVGMPGEAAGNTANDASGGNVADEETGGYSAYQASGNLANEATLNVANDAKLGEILVDGKGMTLYIFTKDMPGKSNCSDDCLASWPPLLTQGTPKLGEGVDDSLVGTAELADGSLIVTYKGMPLYYWINDSKPGDTTGQGVGSVWYVISPDGKPVTQ